MDSPQNSVSQLWDITKRTYDEKNAFIPDGFQFKKTIESDGFKVDIYSDSFGKPVVSFRGSSTVQEWLADTVLVPQQFEGGLVHSGFLYAYKKLNAQIKPYLDENFGSYPDIQFTGHSLGGAMATIAMADYKSEGKHTNGVTFGAPAVGDEDFNKNIDPNQLIRVTNKGDEVPNILQFITGDDLYEQPSNSLHYDGSSMSDRTSALLTMTAIARDAIDAFALDSDNPDLLNYTKGEKYAEMLATTGLYHVSDAYDKVIASMASKDSQFGVSYDYITAEKESDAHNEKYSIEAQMEQIVNVIPELDTIVQHLNTLASTNFQEMMQGSFLGILKELNTIKNEVFQLQNKTKNVIQVAQDTWDYVTGQQQANTTAADFYSNPLDYHYPIINAYNKQFRYNSKTGDYEDSMGVAVQFYSAAGINPNSIVHIANSDSSLPPMNYNIHNVMSLNGKPYVQLMGTNEYVSSDGNVITMHYDGGAEIIQYNFDTKEWMDSDGNVVANVDPPSQAKYQKPDIANYIKEENSPKDPTPDDEEKKNDDLNVLMSSYLDNIDDIEMVTYSDLKETILYKNATGSPLFCHPSVNGDRPYYIDEFAHEKDMEYFIVVPSSRRLVTTQSAMNPSVNPLLNTTCTTAYGFWTLGTPDYTQPPLAGSSLDSFSFAYRCDMDPSSPNGLQTSDAAKQYVCRIIKALESGDINAAKDNQEFVIATFIVKKFLDSESSSSVGIQSIPMQYASDGNDENLSTELYARLRANEYFTDKPVMVASENMFDSSEKDYLSSVVNSSFGNEFVNALQAINKMHNPSETPTPFDTINNGIGRVSKMIKLMESVHLQNHPSYSLLKTFANNTLKADVIAQSIQKELTGIMNQSDKTNFLPSTNFDGITPIPNPINDPNIKIPMNIQTEITNQVLVALFNKMIEPAASD